MPVNITSPKGQNAVKLKIRHENPGYFRFRALLLCVCWGAAVGIVSHLISQIAFGVLNHQTSDVTTTYHGTPVRASLQPDYLRVTRQMQGRSLMDAVAKHYPMNRLQCGNWTAAYTQLHRNILAGKAPQRYAVMQSKMEFKNGLADRLASSVSIFLYALLTDRAFLYEWEGDQPLWSALRSDFIDWRYNGVDKGNKTLLMDYVCDKGMDEYKSFFYEKDLSAIGEGYHTVLWYSDHAGVYKAFENPLLKDKLAGLGLQQDSAFACLFDFLYRPTEAVVDVMAPQLSTLLSPDLLKIGIQIRVGDWQLCDNYLFKPQNYPLLFKHYFECAQEIEDELAQPGQPVVWYLLTDISSLREPLTQRYYPKILSNTGFEVEHIVKSERRSNTGLLYAVGELWSFSLTSAHVITKKSGFGKVPAMLYANSTNHIFTIRYPMNFFNLVALDNRKNVGVYRRRKCTTAFADDLGVVTTDFTGI